MVVFDRRPFVTGLENPRSPIVTCFLDEFGSRDNEIRAEGEGMGEICGLAWKITYI